MNVTDAVATRRTIRAFTEAVPEKAFVEEIVARSRWAPSWGNTQPWSLTVVSGDRLDAFKAENREKALTGAAPEPDVSMPQDWPEANKKRYQDVGRRTLNALSIAREDKEGRLAFFDRMMGLFGAPVLIVMSIEEDLSLEYAMLDAGAFIQTLCLLAHERGLGTCILAAAAQYPELLRKHFAIPASQKIVAGVAMGYPDESDPVNAFERARAESEEIIRWVD